MIAFSCNNEEFHFLPLISCICQETYGFPLPNLHTSVSTPKKCSQLLQGAGFTDSKLLELNRIDLSLGLYVELSGLFYVDHFLMPNFYFHLTTAYNILRMAGVPIGKRHFMINLVSLLKHQSNP